MKKLFILFLLFLSPVFIGISQATSIYSIQHDGVSGPVSIQGIVVAFDHVSDTWIADAAGPYNGILISDTDVATSSVVGDLINVSGTAQEYYNMTEIKSITSHSKVSSGNPPYPATIVTCTDLDMNTAADTLPAEQYEGCLVTIQNAKCFMEQEMTHYEAQVSDDDGAHTTIIDDDADSHLLFGMMSGGIYNITGVVQYTYAQYKICPRNAGDIVVIATSPFNLWVFY